MSTVHCQNYFIVESQLPSTHMSSNELPTRRQYRVSVQRYISRESSRGADDSKASRTQSPTASILLQDLCVCSNKVPWTLFEELDHRYFLSCRFINALAALTLDLPPLSALLFCKSNSLLGPKIAPFVNRLHFFFPPSVSLFPYSLSFSTTPFRLLYKL